MTKKKRKPPDLIKPSDLRAESERLIRAGKMPSLFDVVAAIRKVKGPNHVLPVIQDALIRANGKKQ